MKKLMVIDKRELTPDFPEGKLMCLVDETNRDIAELLVALLDGQGEIRELDVPNE